MTLLISTSEYVPIQDRIYSVQTVLISGKHKWLFGSNSGLYIFKEKTDYSYMSREMTEEPAHVMFSMTLHEMLGICVQIIVARTRKIDQKWLLESI